MREVLRREHPDAVVSISSEVLREYREYERAVTTLVDAAVKPRHVAVRREHRRAAARGRPAGRPVPFYVMKSNGGVLSAEEVVHQPITTVLSGPAAGALGAALVARARRLRPGAHLRRRRHVHRRVGRARRRADADHRGHRRAYPCKIPMIDVVTVGAGGGSVAWVLAGGHAQGRPALGRRRPGAALLRPRRHRADRHRRARRARPHPAAPARRRDPARRRGGAHRPGRARRPAGARPGAGRHRDPGDLGLEPGQRAAPGDREARARRPRLHDDDLRRVRLAAALPPDRHPRAGRPCWCRATPATSPRSGCSPSTSATTTCVRRSAGTTTSTSTWWPACSTSCGRRPRPRWTGEGFARERAPLPADSRPALRRAGVRGAGAGAGRCGRPGVERRGRRGLPRRARAALRLRLPRRPAAAGRVGQPAGHRGRADRAARAAGGRRAGGRPGPGAHRRTPGVLRRLDRHPRLLAARPRAGDELVGPAVIEEFGSTVPLHPGFTASVDRFGNLVVTRTAP